ncbi:MAG TPA: DUF4383 domain-containing protein [Mycobacterium sp.]|nr:DUF4383 domain-containing protein [Mycobacterium sp.]
MAKTPPLMAVQGAAIIVAGALLIVGLLGFLPGVTTHHDLLQFAGHHSGAKLFGVFAVSILHNLLHMALGVAGLVMARTYALARAYFLIGGLAYLGLFAYGIAIDHGSSANVIPVNSADNWLHFGLGVGMLLLGLTLAGQHDPTKRRARVRT